MTRFNTETKRNARRGFIKLIPRMFVSSFPLEKQPLFNLRLYLRLPSFSKKLPIYIFLLNEGFLSPFSAIDFRT